MGDAYDEARADYWAERGREDAMQMRMKGNSDLVSIYISLGHGNKIGITDDNHLIVFNETGYRFDLGLANETKFNNLIEYLQRLKIHAIGG